MQWAEILTETGCFKVQGLGFLSKAITHDVAAAKWVMLSKTASTAFHAQAQAWHENI